MELNNIEKPYSYAVNQIRLLFAEDSLDWDIFPEFNEHEFTIYKNKKALTHFQDLGIPFDGSHYMYRILGFEGDELILSLMDIAGFDLTSVGYDPRSRTSNRWYIATADEMLRIKKLFHIMGLREMLTVSLIAVPEGSTVHE